MALKPLRNPGRWGLGTDPLAPVSQGLEEVLPGRVIHRHPAKTRSACQPNV
jgi:hypothetical protein